ncbi:hypothetical protein FJT64_007499 [Amphibalanus amphitrite]|uniref:Odorant receptor n=1 Tax=Amphibalanus amphitrite TaxID=1232801 RepID=A0A6A4VMP6_AMPAM|nr:hypothetical protein FJT64_007499 [Amphibalanus amphitrite]
MWALRTVPMLFHLLTALGAVNLLVHFPSKVRVVYGLAVYGFFVQTAVALVVLLFGRSELDTLERQLEGLEKMATCNSPVLHRKILTRIALFVTLAAISCGLWISFPLVVGEFTHGNYHIQVELPLALQTQTGYWYSLAFQVVTVVLGTILALTFDCCFFTWLNTVAFHLCTIRNMVQALNSLQELTDTPKVNSSPLMTIAAKTTSWSLSSVLDEKEESPNQELQDLQHNNRREKQANLDQLFVGNASIELEKAVETCDSTETLRLIDGYYSQIASLANSINRLCGLPVLITHAATMTVVLFGVYASILLASEPSKPGRGTQITGFAVFIFMFVLRIIFVSFDGGEITENCEELSASLAAMEWLHLPPEAKQRRKALLQKTAQPLCISAAGVFNINKINVLNIFSFVLTYLVVMVQ